MSIAQTKMATHLYMELLGRGNLKQPKSSLQQARMSIEQLKMGTHHCVALKEPINSVRKSQVFFVLQEPVVKLILHKPPWEFCFQGGFIAVIYPLSHKNT